MPHETYRKAAKAYLAARRGRLVAAPSGPATGMAAASTSPRWSDPWLLLSIKMAQGDAPQASLERIIAAGDALNHAIFTDQELEGGFHRLEGGGHIAVEGGGCAVTEKFRKAWSAAGADKRRYADQHLDAVRKILGAPPWQPRRSQ